MPPHTVPPSAPSARPVPAADQTTGYITHEPTERIDAAPRRWSGHILALDGLRGVAILLVMLLHFRMGEPVTLLGRAYVHVAGTGWAGVDLFFVLSGFLITGILFDAKGSASYFRNFYTRRVLRIFPLYYGFLLLRFVVLPAVYHPNWTVLDNSGAQQAWAWLYLTNVQIATRGWGAPASFTAHFWSLAIEEQFYLLWPLVVRLASRRQLIAVCAIMVVAAFAARLLLVAGYGANDAAYVLTPTRVDALAAGALVALSIRGPDGITPLLRWRGPMLVAGGAIIAALLLRRGPVDLHRGAVATLGFSAFALFFAGVLVSALAAPVGSRTHRVLTSRVLRFFGRYSYAMYMIHLPLLPILSVKVLNVDRVPPDYGLRMAAQIAFVVIGTGVTALLAVVSWHAYEKHFLKLKDRFAPVAHRRADAPERVPAAP